MGGLAVAVDWSRPVGCDDLDPMLALVPHRARGGVGRECFRQAALAETLSTWEQSDNPQITSIGSLSIVGDLRLWDRSGLRARAGGASLARGMDDRCLLLAAYQRSGLGFLDDVDGDFAFVIWDEDNQEAIAVRDRFGSKPLFFERTPTGIRFASEPKQLAATSARPVEPCARSVVEYLTNDYDETRFTFFEGIERVRPSTAFIISPSGERQVRYWNPSPDTIAPARFDDAADAFRETLIHSVRRRLASYGSGIGHLSGGLDSSSIAASAHILSARESLSSDFHTVSAVFPGSSIDESKWIADTTALQPFPHHEFVPRIATVDQLDEDMWTIDQPGVSRIRDMWAETAAIANRAGASVVLTGSGGDEILDEEQLFIDRVRSGSVHQRLRDVSSVARTGRGGLRYLTIKGARRVLPSRARPIMNRILMSRTISDFDLIPAETRRALEEAEVTSASTRFGFPSEAQNDVIAATQHPFRSWLNENQEAHHASLGVDVTSPFVDRGVVESVASIPIADRPFDGQSKSLIRRGFAEWLPRSVLERRTKTVADDYLDTLLTIHGAEYRDRYPTVPAEAERFVNPEAYGQLIRQFDAGIGGSVVREPLWSAWTVIAWLDGLARYR